MNWKPLLLGGLVATPIVLTGVVHFTTEGDKITFAPAPVVEAVPAPVVKAVPLPPQRPVLKAAAKCPPRGAH